MLGPQDFGYYFVQPNQSRLTVQTSFSPGDCPTATTMAPSAFPSRSTVRLSSIHTNDNSRRILDVWDARSFQNGLSGDELVLSLYCYSENSSSAQRNHHVPDEQQQSTQQLTAPTTPSEVTPHFQSFSRSNDSPGAEAHLGNSTPSASQPDGDMPDAHSRFSQDSTLAFRGKGRHICPHARNGECTKGGTGEDGSVVIFERNSAFRYVNQSPCPICCIRIPVCHKYKPSSQRLTVLQGSHGQAY